MTSVSRIVKLPPSPDRLFLRLSLFREHFVYLIGKDGYRVRKAAEFHGHPAVIPNARDAPGEADERAFGDLLNHSNNVSRGGDWTR